jgi:5-deoxy-D-glucuronate isomerase
MGVDAYSSHAVEDARSPDEQTNARFASNVAISGRGIAASLLIAEAYESNSQIDSFLRDVHDGDAHEAKDDSDAQIMQGVCYNLCTCHRNHDV